MHERAYNMAFNSLYGPFKRYTNTRFRIQSILLPDWGIPNKGTGQAYIAPDLSNNYFRLRDFGPYLVNIVLNDGVIRLADDVNVDDKRLEAVISKIKPKWYMKTTDTGRLLPQHRRYNSRDWDSKLVGNIVERGEYLTLDRLVMVNPSEWGQIPVQRTPEQITAKKHPGRNITGHKISNH